MLCLGETLVYPHGSTHKMQSYSKSVSRVCTVIFVVREHLSKITKYQECQGIISVRKRGFSGIVSSDYISVKLECPST